MNRKYIICAAASAVLLIGLAAFISNTDGKGRHGNEAQTLDQYQLEPYLNLCGWDVSLISSEEIRIPSRFEGVYSEYAALQKEQGFDLDSHKGCDAMRYTYSVNNYGRDNVRAELILCENVLIAADIYENTPDGFMERIK